MKLPISFLPAICLGLFLPLILSTLPPIGFIGFLCILLLCFVKRYIWVRHLLFILLGFLYTVIRVESALNNRLPLELNKQTQELIIVVRDLPQQTEYGHRFIAEVLSNTPHIPKKIILTDYQKQQWPTGSKWRVQAALNTPVSTVNLTGFNSEAWHLSHRIGATGSVKKNRHFLGYKASFATYLDQFRAFLSKRIHDVGIEYPRGASLIAALTIGEQSALTQSDWQAFRQTGITHLVSISGLHVTMVAIFAAMCAHFILSFLQIKRFQPKTIMLWAGVLAALAYALLTGFSVPTQRSVFMLLAAATMICSNKYFTAWQIWWTALTLVLLLDPLYALTIGFWLSFGLVASLLWVSTNRKQQQNKWQTAIRAQTAATVASIVPLSYFFGQFPILSPAVNSIAIPWVSWVLTPLALISLIMPFDLPLLLACALAQYSLDGLDILLPLAYEYSISKAPIWLLTTSLIGTLLFLAPTGTPMRSLGLLSIIMVLVYQPTLLQKNEAKITILDVGQGTAILVQTQNHTLLFDTGMGSGHKIVLPNLRALGVRHLDKLVLSHNDADHDSGLGDIFTAFPHAAILAGQPEAYPDYSVQHCTEGVNWQWDGVLFEWLTPNINANNKNDQSCVLRILAQKQALLITGDLSVKGEKQLIHLFDDSLLSQTLVLGHHGSKTSTDRQFLQTVDPDHVIVSAGFANRYRHPHPEVINTVTQHGATIWRTDTQGAISITLAEETSIEQQTQYKPFWQLKPFH
ncbi:DNA internalization-related competence protein ComEC/Rec2 [Neisseria sp. Ec49-e6-T10]|uniref:DNA internalization-related competence protein ComEC/Rec2 n=1 Tax=Neisseria sp. Ec49-e6-T10 TaxID=3140744 RepID=UPI003EC048B2